MSDRIVLAYSGGLDTSVCIGWLTEETGRRWRRLRSTSAKAGRTWRSSGSVLDCGAVEAVVVDAKDEFAEDFCRPRAAR